MASEESVRKLHDSARKVQGDRDKQYLPFHLVTVALGQAWAGQLSVFLQREVPSLPPHVISLMMLQLKSIRAGRSMGATQDDFDDAYNYLAHAYEEWLNHKVVSWDGAANPTEAELALGGIDPRRREAMVKFLCPAPGCGSARIKEHPSGSRDKYHCMDCASVFDVPKEWTPTPHPDPEGAANTYPDPPPETPSFLGAVARCPKCTSANVWWKDGEGRSLLKCKRERCGHEFVPSEVVLTTGKIVLSR